MKQALAPLVTACRGSLLPPVLPATSIPSQMDAGGTAEGSMLAAAADEQVLGQQAERARALLRVQAAGEALSSAGEQFC